MSQGEVDRIFGTASRLSALSQAAQLMRDANAVGRRECGNCAHWMKKSDCPREVGDSFSGRSRGPSSADLACSDFKILPAFAALNAKRVKQANDALAALEKKS